MDLLFPIGNVKTVDIKIFTIKMLKDLVSHNIQSGNFFSLGLSNICNLTEDQCKEVSIYDYYNIVISAWIKSYAVKHWNCVAACDCGKKVVINHQLANNVVAPEVFFKDHKIGELNITFQPLKVDYLNKIVSGEEEFDVLGLDQIKSVDGDTKYDKESIPLNVFNQIEDLLSDDGGVEKATKASKECECGKTHQSEIGLHNGAFLRNR